MVNDLADVRSRTTTRCVAGWRWFGEEPRTRWLHARRLRIQPSDRQRVLRNAVSAVEAANLGGEVFERIVLAVRQSYDHLVHLAVDPALVSRRADDRGQRRRKLNPLKRDLVVALAGVRLLHHCEAAYPASANFVGFSAKIRWHCSPQK